jgi:hypothetical protein
MRTNKTSLIVLSIMLTGSLLLVPVEGQNQRNHRQWNRRHP